MDNKTDNRLTIAQYKIEVRRIITAMIRILFRALRKIDDAEYRKTLEELKEL